MCAAPTSGPSANDEFSDLVVNKDDDAVRHRAEPPVEPANESDGTSGNNFFSS